MNIQKTHLLRFPEGKSDRLLNYVFLKTIGASYFKKTSTQNRMMLIFQIKNVSTQKSTKQITQQIQIIEIAHKRSTQNVCEKCAPITSRTLHIK